MFRASTFVSKVIRSPLKTSVRHYPYPGSFVNFLRNLPEPQYSKIDNGLRIVTEERDVCNACIGIFVDAGSRYESDFENGLAHFFEHIAFKSTNARCKTALEDQMASTGAQFQCFTTREMVGYYVMCLREHITLCTDILTDCVFNNAYCEPDIECQKKVVYKEMEDHDSDPNALLDDFLNQTAFQGTQLAKTVMGPSCNLHNFDAPVICRYMLKNYDADRTVFVGVGGVKEEQMISLAKCYLDKLEPSKNVETDPYRYTGSQMIYRQDSLPLANVAVAVEGPAFCHDDTVVIDLATEILGGWDRTQPGGLNHSFPIARAGSYSPFCDAYKAFNINYKDTGLFGVKFSSRRLDLEDMLNMVQDEIMNVCNTITFGEVERGKRFLKTKILSRNDNIAKTAVELARWTLYNGFRPPVSELVCSVDRVGVSDVRETITQYVYDKCPVVAAIGPTEGLPDYNRIRAGNYWLRM